MLSERTESSVGADGVLCVPRIQERAPAVHGARTRGQNAVTSTGSFLKAEK